MKKSMMVAAASAFGLAMAAGAAHATPSVSLVGTCNISVEYCLFDGNVAGDASSPLIDAAYNGQSPTPSPLLDLADLAFFGEADSGLPAHGGTYIADFLVSYFAVKAGDQFTLYKVSTPSTSFVWSTAGLVNKKGIEHDVSHIAFWGAEPGTPGGGVPEPATWAMMIAGFGAVGAVLRRRKVAFAA